MSDAGLSPEHRQGIRDQLRSELGRVKGVYPADQAPRPVSIGRLRSRGLRPKELANTMTLVDSGGVLIWEDGFGLGTVQPGLRRGLRRGVPGADVLDRVQADPLELNEVADYLKGLDRGWNPNQGIRRWDGHALQPVAPGAAAPAAGRILVVIHGTFSRSDVLFEQLQQTEAGRALLAKAATVYAAIFAFDHPTISVSPILNAVELGRFFESSAASVDLICHSRGGLVARWWLEAMDHGAGGARRAVLVGCPLGGTSLASPSRLRHVLSWFTNINRALATGSAAVASAIPFMSVVAGLLRVVATVSSLAARTPVVDAAISMVPGLAALSKNNFELERLNVAGVSRPEYSAVTANFEPDSPDWRFWRFFKEARQRGLDALADAVFTGQNDLVVDTSSMTYLDPQARIDAVHDFGTQATVHHTNYFLQKETIAFIGARLGIT